MFTDSPASGSLRLIGTSADAKRRVDDEPPEGARHDDLRLVGALVAGAPVGMAVVALDGRFTIVNPALCAMLGYAERELLGKTFADITPREDDPLDAAVVDALLHGNVGPCRFEKRYLRADGSAVWVALSVSMLGDGADVLAYLCYIEDVSERKAIDARAHELIHHDELTQLANRRSLDAELPLRIAAARRDGADLHVVMIDLDRFKAINDAFGHQAGDAVLAAAASVFALNVREHDGAFRYGGDEFTLILERVPRETLVALLGRVRDALGALEIALEGEPQPLRASFGVASLRRDGEDAAALLAQADAALLRSKRAGGDTVAFA